MNPNRILVIEDEFLIGMDVVSTLERAGFSHVEHVTSELEALQLINTKPWNAVVADANLNGRSIENVALQLQNKSISFVILTGYERDNLPATIRDVPVLSKPFSPARLVEAVKSLCIEA